MKRRAGVTLMEVLMAIFICALGLLALLTLFPLGALSMAQAVRDERCAQTAANAMAGMRIANAHLDTNVVPKMQESVYLPPNPLPMPWPPAINPNWPRLPTEGPSNSVFIDPFGTAVNLPWVGAPYGLITKTNPAISGGGLVPRVNASTWLTSSSAWHAWCTNLDDLGFTVDGRVADGSGQPAAMSGANVDRGGRYSWAALLRRPRVADSFTEVSVVVFDGRPLTGTPDDPTYAAAPDPNGNPNVVVLTHNADGPPALRPGHWLLLIWEEQNPLLREYGFAPVQAFFYRVVGITQGNGSTEVELQTALRTFVFPPRDINQDGTITTNMPNEVSQYGITSAVVMERVAEVFDRGILGP